VTVRARDGPQRLHQAYRILIERGFPRAGK
jgi:hypothetical protein